MSQLSEKELSALKDLLSDEDLLVKKFKMLAEHAEKVGAHATSAVPCVYYRLGEESVYRHWTEITKAADLPFFIYNIPQLTGFNLSMNLFNRMLENDRVAGVKCSSDPAQDILCESGKRTEIHRWLQRKGI